MTGNLATTAREILTSGEKSYSIYRVDRLPGVEASSYQQRPLAQKIVLENLLRNYTGESIKAQDLSDLANGRRAPPDMVLPFYPARILLQDFTGVPVLVDLASMRSAVAKRGLSPATVDSTVQIDLVIDHSVQVDRYGTSVALEKNMELEYARNGERYSFLKWAQEAFPKLRVVPPGNGICHQVNMEFLARVVASRTRSGVLEAFPDTLIGTDSHTTMVNGLGVLGWGVGGIEAEAVMLGEPYLLSFPEVIGVRLEGSLKEGVTATDLVLTVTKLLRKEGVVGKFVEFYGPGLSALSIPERATISNMCPEYGATAAIFPVDAYTISYLRKTGRDPDAVSLVERYAKVTQLWWDTSVPAPQVEKELLLRLEDVRPTMAGPKNPDEAHSLSEVPRSFREALEAYRKGHPWKGDGDRSSDGRIAIAAITSCTNTSNPAVMIGAGLMARKAMEKGLTIDPFTKASLAPGSRVVSAYLERAGLLASLSQLGFSIVGYGCTTCIGNSGPLSHGAEEAVRKNDAFLVSVLSGNRNFEARVHNEIRANYLASPMLVVAAAIAGRIDIDLMKEALGKAQDGSVVHLRDIWPSNTEITQSMDGAMHREMFVHNYSNVFAGGPLWDDLKVKKGTTYDWDEGSTYLREVPFFGEGSLPATGSDGILLKGARALALLGDGVSTDHISPAGEIPVDSPAGRYLIDRGVARTDFNTYGSRRGNHEVMMRGTFANTRLKNYMVKDKEGGFTIHQPSGRETTIFYAAEEYGREHTPLVVIAGRRYGQGSSRDWAAKGPKLLGVRAVIAESFERIHRSNLAGMGILPLEFTGGQGWRSLGITGKETFQFLLIDQKLEPRARVEATATRSDGHETKFHLVLRMDNSIEIDYLREGGVLSYAMKKLLSGSG